MKVGRNDPCPCGSGKKYKQCCMNKSQPQSSLRKKITAKWLNAPSPQPAQYSDLMERTFGNAIHAQQETFHPVKPAEEELADSDNKDQN